MSVQRFSWISGLVCCGISGPLGLVLFDFRLADASYSKDTGSGLLRNPGFGI